MNWYNVLPLDTYVHSMCCSALNYTILVLSKYLCNQKQKASFTFGLISANGQTHPDSAASDKKALREIMPTVADF